MTLGTDPPPTDKLTRAEIGEELTRLFKSPSGIARARRLARGFAGGLRHLNAEDLLQEACEALLSGDRGWRRGLPALTILNSSMKSIASNSRKKLDYDLGGEASSADPHGADASALNPSDNEDSVSDPAKTVAEQSALAALQREFAGDSEVQLLIDAMQNGFSGAEIGELLGWDKKTHDSARKRLMRRVDKLAAQRREK